MLNAFTALLLVTLTILATGALTRQACRHRDEGQETPGPNRNAKALRRPSPACRS